MLLRHRATQAECFDAPGRDPEIVRSDYGWLARVNQITRFAWPFQHLIPATLGRDACTRLRLLDVGAGDGRLADALEAWARHRGWDWQVTSLDYNPLCASFANRPIVVGSATALPFPDRAFDVVIASTMTHHLTDAEVEAHFREAGRVADRLVLIVDLHRNPIFAAVLWSLLVALRAPRHFRADGILSVRRGWRVPEWRTLARRAGLVGAQVTAWWAMLVVLRWTRSDRL